MLRRLNGTWTVWFDVPSGNRTYLVKIPLQKWLFHTTSMFDSQRLHHQVNLQLPKPNPNVQALFETL